MNSSIGIALPNGELRSKVAALFGKSERTRCRKGNPARIRGSEHPIVRQNAFRGNLRSGRQANHHASAPIGTTNNPRPRCIRAASDYPRGGLQNCRMNNRSQCNGSGNNERPLRWQIRRRRFCALLHDDNSVNRTVLSFKI
jgi:hypothetical protein